MVLVIMIAGCADIDIARVRIRACVTLDGPVAHLMYHLMGEGRLWRERPNSPAC